MNFSHNKLVSNTQNLDISFNGLEKLEILDLESNSLTSLGKYNFNELLLLRVLSLRNNRISKIHALTFSKQISLKTLDLGKNRLRYINNTHFINLVYTSKMKLDNNFIQNVDDTTFTNMRSLTILDLSFNILTTIGSKIFNGLHKLRYLRLDNNHINLIYFDFSELTKLNQLYLQNNRIVKLHDIAFSRYLLNGEIWKRIDISSNANLNCVCEISKFGDSVHHYVILKHLEFSKISQICVYDNQISKRIDCQNYDLEYCEHMNCRTLTSG